MTELSLRERKKARTRDRLIEIARRKFIEQGYAQTTLEEICEEAEVSIRTLLRYFESKEGLALAPLYSVFERFRGMLDDPNRKDAVSVWRRHLENELVELRDAGEILAVYQTYFNHPTLLGGSLALQHRFEDALAAAIADDATVERSQDLYGRVLSAALVGAQYAALREWARGGGHDDLPEIALEIVGWVMDNFPTRDHIDRPPAVFARALPA